MRLVSLGLFAVCCMLAGCVGKNPPKREHINLWVKNPRPIRALDTDTKRFINNEVFLPNVVRLPHTYPHAFVFLDSPVIDSKIKMLQPGSRDSFYQSVARNIAESDLEVYKKSWDLPELQTLQEGDGGYGSVFTVITHRPVRDSPVYVLEVRKNNIAEFPVHHQIGYIRYHTRTKETSLADQSGYFVTLKAYRAAAKY